MNGETYAVVTADGREHPAVDLATIRHWYMENQLSDSSLIFSSEAGDWRSLNRIFDTTAWNPGSNVVTNGPGNIHYPNEHNDEQNDEYFEELTSLAVPPDADFKTVQHFTSYERTTISKASKHGMPGLTALVTILVFGIFGLVSYFVLTNFVFYSDTVSFSNNKGLTAMKTQVLGKPFEDPNGVKITLPAGWSQVSADLPEAKVQAPEAKMFAVNFDKKMFSALEVLPADGKDLKIKMSEILQGYREDSNGPFSVIADHETQIGSIPARKSIFSRRDKAIDASTTTHMLIAQHQGHLYVFQIWTATDKYAGVAADFDHAEQALTLP